MRWLIFVTAATAVLAQLEHTYERHRPSRSGYKSPVVELPLQDNEALQRSEQRHAEDFHKTFKFGVPVPVKTSIYDGEWTDVRDGRIWSITFASQGARSMNLKFARFHIPTGAALWIHGGADDKVQGAFTELNNYESGEFVNWPMEGDRITLEYFEPANLYGKPVFDIQHVVHGYKARLGCMASGPCNVNSACDEKYGGLHSNQIRAGALVLRTDGLEWCSGSLINTVGNTGRQLFLTAEHCGSPLTNFGSLKFEFRSPECETTTCPDGKTIGDLKVLHMKEESDTALLEVGERIPEDWNVFLSGFSASRTPSSSVAGIHHPSGDVQKMAYAYKAPTYDRWGGTPGPSTHWRISSWDNLTTTEGGSSGSSLYDANQRIIGQLTGGSASCGNPAGWDAYGALYYSWAEGLNAFLDPTNTGTDVVDGVNLNDVRRQRKYDAKLQEARPSKYDVVEPKSAPRRFNRKDVSPKYYEGARLKDVRAKKHGYRPKNTKKYL